MNWISVDKQLPELSEVGDGAFHSEYVLVTDGERWVEAYYYDYTKREAKPNYATGKGWYCHNIRKSEITHWMPIILPNSEVES